MHIKTMLFDVETMFAEGLRAVLQSPKWVHESQAKLSFEIIGIYSNRFSAMNANIRLRPDLVIIDPFTFFEYDGFDLIKCISTETPSTKILIVCPTKTDFLMRPAFKVKAHGIILKEREPQELINAIYQIMNGNTYYDPKLTVPVFKRDSSHRLGLREIQILKSIANGKPSKQIAVDCKISIKTVETHRRNIMQKLKICSIAGLTKYAVREGLVQL